MNSDAGDGGRGTSTITWFKAENINQAKSGFSFADASDLQYYEAQWSVATQYIGSRG